jgi:hypothetical protein
MTIKDPRSNDGAPEATKFLKRRRRRRRRRRRFLWAVQEL